MSLNQWVDNGWLRRHKTSQEEIENLVMIIDRDLKDAKGKWGHYAAFDPC